MTMLIKHKPENHNAQWKYAGLWNIVNRIHSDNAHEEKINCLEYAESVNQEALLQSDGVGILAWTHSLSVLSLWNG